MSDTHVNAYALELQEKRTQRVVLDGEIKALEKKVKTLSPELPTPEEAREAQEPKAEDVEKTAHPMIPSTQPTKRTIKKETDAKLAETQSMSKKGKK